MIILLNDVLNLIKKNLSLLFILWIILGIYLFIKLKFIIIFFYIVAVLKIIYKVTLALKKKEIYINIDNIVDNYIWLFLKLIESKQKIKSTGIKKIIMFNIFYQITGISFFVIKNWIILYEEFRVEYETSYVLHNKKFIIFVKKSFKRYINRILFLKNFNYIEDSINKKFKLRYIKSPLY